MAQPLLPSGCPEGGGGGCRSRLNGVVVDRADRAEIVAETPSNHEIVMCARPDFGFSAQVLPMLATPLLRVVSAPWRPEGAIGVLMYPAGSD